MHHLILFVPLLALALFLILPWPLALAYYLPILVVSLFGYWKVLQSLRKPSVTGQSAMIGDQAVVITVDEDQVEVHYHGEIWRAIPLQPVYPGQQVIIEKIDDLTLLVSPLPQTANHHSRE